MALTPEEIREIAVATADEFAARLRQHAVGSGTSNPHPTPPDQTEVIVTAKLNPRFPTAEHPQRRFDKELTEPPWRDAIGATIKLDDPVWELLGWPKQLRVAISPA